MKRKEEIDPIDAYVGRRLKLARDLNGLSQAKLGKPQNVTFQQIQKYETGNNRIAASRLWHFAAYLSLPVGWFFEGLPATESILPKMGIIDARVLQDAETLELIRYYHSIDDAEKRRAVFNFLKAMSP